MHTKQVGTKRAVIVGKTRMSEGYWCIGALTLDDWRSLRLLPVSGGRAWAPETTIELEQVYEIAGSYSALIDPPHTEDFRLSSLRFVGSYSGNLPQDICAHVAVARGELSSLYQGCLRRLHRSSLGVLRDNIPNFSTQFWVPDQSLRLTIKWEKAYYLVGGYEVRYVGARTPIQEIPAGSLVRLSLSRWWAPEGATEQACYLQVSGWWLPPSANGSW